VKLAVAFDAGADDAGADTMTVPQNRLSWSTSDRMRTAAS
jgi:hypothetical protein